MAPNLKLSYFDITGRAEPVRLAFVIGGIEFEDHRFKREEWPEIKKNTPFGSVPVLEVDGEVLAQSDAMLRYAGKLAGIYPEDPLEAFRVDEIIDTLVDGTMAAFTYRGPDKDKLREAREEFVKQSLPRYMGALDKRIKASGKTPFVLGEKISIADIKIQQVCSMITSGFLDFVDASVMDDYPTMKAITQAVLEVPEVAKWYADQK